MARKLIYFLAAMGMVTTILIAAVANVNHGHGPGHHDEHGEHSEHGDEHAEEGHEEEHGEEEHGEEEHEEEHGGH
ncbi:MAG: hypothetical protein IJR00_00830 [Lachnospiraceae bacterium]|nr:hypothetical protein [Lachnospiraceae bacterium]